jgi:hypothetical protein
MPNNAVLVVAGDFLKKQNNGFKNTLVVSKGPTVERQTFVKSQLLKQLEQLTKILTFRSDGCSCLQNAIYENT